MTTDTRFITSKNASYQIIRKLGEGFAGEVFEVRDEARGENIALKLLKKEAFAEGQLQAFKREFSVLSGFHHPHICKVYDFGFAEGDERFFFTVEMIEGESLYSYTEKLSLEQMEEIFVQITDALGFIHAAGLIHFDLKGSNILVSTQAGKPLSKIVDFGLAAPPLDAPEQIVGTIRYISPEMIMKNQAIDYRADLYSLGMVLYRMLAGRYPPQGVTMQEVLAWHTAHDTVDVEPLKQKGVPKYLIDVVEKLLNIIPAERFSSAPVIIKYIELHSGRSYKKSQRQLLTTLAEEGPLVGRGDLMYEIRSTLHRLGTGETLGEGTPQALVLTGPPGIGKSRMLKEARYISQLGGLATVLINGQNEGQDIFSFGSALGASKPAGPNRAQAIQGILEAVLRQQKFCLMVDNLDECNQAVKDVVLALAGSLYSSRFMGKPLPIYLITTMTTTSPEEGLPVPLYLGVKVENLKPFARDDIIGYLTSFLGETNPPKRQIDDLFKFSGGIPELVRTAIASLDSPTARLTKDTGQFFAASIGRLGAEAKRLIGFLAIAERPLTYQQMSSMAGFTIEPVAEELIKAGLVVRNREAESYEMTANAISVAARAALPEVETRAIAAALLKLVEAEANPDIDAVVKFASITLSPAEAAGYILKAAETKEARQEISQSYGYYSQVLAIIGDSDPRAPGIHRKAARYLILSGKYDAAKEHIKAASLSGARPEDFTALSWIDRLEYRPQDAQKHIEKAIAEFGTKPKAPEYLKLLNEKALCHLQAGEFDEAVRIFDESNKSASSLSQDLQLQVTNNNLGMALAKVGRFDEAIAFYIDKHKRFSADKRTAASVLSQLGYVYEQAGRRDEALETYKKSWELASQTGDIHSGAAVLGNIINLCQSKALFSDALEYANESLKLASQASSEKDLAGNLLTIGILNINMGLDDVAQKYLNEASAIFGRLNDVRMGSWALLSFAYLYKNLGKDDEALASLDKVIKNAEEQKDRELLTWAHYGAAEVLLESGRPADAAKHFEEIHLKWEGPEMAREDAVKVELLRLKLAIAKDEHSIETAGTLEKLAVLAQKMGFRELASESYHTLGNFCQKLGKESESAKFISKAKEIIDDITATLSEEYKDSFTKQKFRRMVFDDSVKLSRAFVKEELEKLSKKKAGPATVKIEGEATPSDSTTSLPKDVIPDETKSLTKEKK